MPSYDAAYFDPPAPVARVTLRNPQSGATASAVLLLVDTGADITGSSPCLRPVSEADRRGLGDAY